MARPKTFPKVPPPSTTPSIPTAGDGQVLVRHPGYPDTHNLLFGLLAADLIPDSSPDEYGLCAHYVLDACGIVAGNRWDGFLSKTNPPTDPIDPSTILEIGQYYFHLPADDHNPYKVVPNFDRWLFPHQNLPAHWAQLSPSIVAHRSHARSTLSTVLKNRDVSCRISACREQTQTSHLCPRKERQWYMRNSMGQYNKVYNNNVNDLVNVLLLRDDLHTSFDKPMFVFFPKPTDDSKDSPYDLFIHVVEYSEEYMSLSHNRPLQSVNCKVEMYFTRFAWTVFTQLSGFFDAPVERLLLTTVNEETNSNEYTSYEDIQRILKPPRSESGSGSPNKRKATDDAKQATENDGADGYMSAKDNSRSAKVNQTKTYTTHKLGDGTEIRMDQDGYTPWEDIRKLIDPPARKRARPDESSFDHDNNPLSDPSTIDDFPPHLPQSLPENDESRINLLAHFWLERERDHSGISTRKRQKVRHDQKFKDLAYTGRYSMSAAEAEKFYRVNGCEIIDDHGEVVEEVE